jgi:DNA-directed RNA polymerase subunit RPC12/RpoP
MSVAGLKTCERPFSAPMVVSDGGKEPEVVWLTLTRDIDGGVVHAITMALIGDTNCAGSVVALACGSLRLVESQGSAYQRNIERDMHDTPVTCPGCEAKALGMKRIPALEATAVALEPVGGARDE